MNVVHALARFYKVRRSDWPAGQYIVFESDGWYMCSYAFKSDTKWYTSQFDETGDWVPYDF